jgi:hypothetical protein
MAECRNASEATRANFPLDARPHGRISEPPAKPPEAPRTPKTLKALLHPNDRVNKA